MPVTVATTQAQKQTILGLPQIAVAVRGFDEPVDALLVSPDVLWLSDGVGQVAIVRRQVIHLPLANPEYFRDMAAAWWLLGPAFRSFQFWRDCCDYLLVSGAQTQIEDYAVVDVDDEWPAALAGAEGLSTVPVSKYLIPRGGWPGPY